MTAAEEKGLNKEGLKEVARDVAGSFKKSFSGDQPDQNRTQTSASNGQPDQNRTKNSTTGGQPDQSRTKTSAE
jgi:hypothetical protein